MPPIVRVVTGREPDSEVFVSLEETALVLADVRRALPRLREELRKKWPVEDVEIENRIPRRKNPYEPSQVAMAACVGLVVTFSLAAAKAAGSKFGEGVGEEIARCVRRWIRRIAKPKAAPRKSA